MNRIALRPKIRQATNLCWQKKVRFTPLRRRIFSLIIAAGKPVSAYEILEHIPKKSWSATPPTVYRAIDFLLQQRLIHKIESLHAYIGCSHPEKDHFCQFLVCTDCGLVNEIESKRLSGYVRSAEKLTHFQVHRPVIELLGTCSQCTQ